MRATPAPCVRQDCGRSHAGSVSCSPPAVPTEVTSDRYIGTSRDALAPQQLGSATSDVAEADVRALIEPNGPGSWMKNATWYEVVFDFRNRSDGDVAITEISAVNQQGVFADQVAGPFLPQLSATSRQESQTTESRPWWESLVWAPAMLFPPAIVVPALADEHRKASAARRTEAQTADSQKLSAEYQARQVQSFTLATEGSLVGSAFFPVSSGEIEEVVFSTRASGKKAELRVRLTHSASSTASK